MEKYYDKGKTCPQIKSIKSQERKMLILTCENNFPLDLKYDHCCVEKVKTIEKE